MANDSAWTSGWDMGSAAAQKSNAAKATKRLATGGGNLGSGGLGSKPTATPTMGSGGAMSKGIMAGQNTPAKPSTLKHGGKVKKTGLAKVHKGEVVVTASKAKRLKNEKKTGSCKRTTSKR